MEGLLLAAELGRLEPLLGQGRGPWRFPDPATFVLPLGRCSLWLRSDPSGPRLEVKEGRSQAGMSGTPFQQLLQARVRGELAGFEQLALDRVVRLDFAPHEGFVRESAASLWVELTGRNSNIVLVDADGVISGVQRPVTSAQNRYRQLVPGAPYVPPPPYDKVDPRVLGAEATARLLLGRPLRDLRSVADGLGPELTHAVAELAGLPAREMVDDAALPALASALGSVLADPAAAVAATRGGAASVGEVVRESEREQLMSKLRRPLERRRELLRRRIADVARLEEAAAGAAELRHQADLLMTYVPPRQPGRDSVDLIDFEGNPVSIELSPRLDAIGTAQALYERARRHEQRLARAREMMPGIERELAEAQAELAALADLPLPELRRSARGLAGAPGRFRTEVGMRVLGPHGFEIVIGRNARENDVVTFRLARSRDVWLHVQGYRGSHVLVRAGGREVPFDTILFAARLAAGHSQAAESDNVAVDYTLRKNVWRARGAAPGAVHFSDQKTVFVTPLRRADAEEELA